MIARRTIAPLEIWHANHLATTSARPTALPSPTGQEDAR
jgi:hypothetical protein